MPGQLNTETDIARYQAVYMADLVEITGEALKIDSRFATNVALSLRLMATCAESEVEIRETLAHVCEVIANQLATCMMTGCTDEVNHTMLETMMNGVFQSRTVVINAALTQGIVAGQSNN